MEMYLIAYYLNLFYNKIKYALKALGIRFIL